MTIDELHSGPPKCLTPRCTRPAAPALKRGLCMACHSSAKKMVASGMATWEGLESLGLASPDADQDLFAKALEEARRNNAVSS